jgi:Trypsin-like peptidase domain
MLSKILGTIVVIVCLIGLNTYNKTTDHYIRDRVLLLHSVKGGCSGVKVIAPSMKTYILTANHCKAVMTGPYMEVQDEQGEEHDVKIIAEDPDHDLLLLESFDNNGVEVATHLYRHQHIHAITHGAMEPSFRTDGEALKLEDVDVLMFQIESPEDEARCTSGHNQRIDTDFIFQVCIKHMRLISDMLLVWPGSSGGPILDSWGRLVGIVSVSGGEPGMSGMVPLNDIKAFLRDR